MHKNARTQSGRPMRKYAGSCGITTAWRKRRKDPDSRILKVLYTMYRNERKMEIFDDGREKRAA